MSRTNEAFQPPLVYLTSQVAKHVPRAGDLVALDRQRLIDGRPELVAPLDQAVLLRLSTLALGCQPGDALVCNLGTGESSNLDRPSDAEVCGLERERNDVLCAAHATADLQGKLELAISHVPVRLRRG